MTATTQTQAPADFRAAVMEISAQLSDDQAIVDAIDLAVGGIAAEADCDRLTAGVRVLLSDLERRLASRGEALEMLVGSGRAPAAEESDTLLLEAYKDWVTSSRADDEASAQPDFVDSEYRANKVNAEIAERAMERLPAHTVAGVAAKLKLVLHGYACDSSAELGQAFFRGEPITEQVLARGDYREVMLVRAVDDLERLAG